MADYANTRKLYLARAAHYRAMLTTHQAGAYKSEWRLKLRQAQQVLAALRWDNRLANVRQAVMSVL